MTISNVVGIISVVCALISTICAIIACKEQCKTQKKLEKEKNQLSQGRFYCTKYYLHEKNITLYISNQSVYSVNYTNCEWDGEVTAKTEIVNKNENMRDFQINLKFDCNQDDFQNIVGYVIINYMDIYNNKCKCKLKVDLKDLDNCARNVLFFNE